MHIYAFGSICRGEISAGSDIDLLALTNGYDAQLDPEVFSVYSYKRIQRLWREGNPFAWHLSLESKLIFASDQNDYLKDLGSPSVYKNCIRDCDNFYSLFQDARTSIVHNVNSRIFDLSTIFLSIRNIAICFSLGVMGQPTFSRSAAFLLGRDNLLIPKDCYSIFERARLLCSRGQGKNIKPQEVDIAISQLDEIDHWMGELVNKVKMYERIR